MEDRVFKIKMFLYDEPYYDFITFFANDTKSCKFDIELYKSFKTLYDVVDKRVTITIENSSGYILVSDVEVNNGVISYVLDNSSIANKGTFKVTVQAYGVDNSRVTFGTFKYKVLSDVDTSGVMTSSSFPILTSLIAETNQALLQEDIRVNRENARASKENERLSSEDLRKTEETNRISSESTRNTNETFRISKESARVTNENTRIATENERRNSEIDRLSNETSRESSEISRAASENDRTNKENARITKENERLSSELTRIDNEKKRVAENETRNVEFVEFKADIRKEIIPKEKSIKNINIVSNAITGSILATGKNDGINIFDKTTLKYGYVINIDGTEGVLNNFACTDFINVENYREISLSHAKVSRVAYGYDANKVMIKTFLGSETTGKFDINITIDIVYIRVNIYLAETDVNTFMITDKASYPSRYVPYGGFIDWLKIEDKNVYGKFGIDKIEGSNYTNYVNRLTVINNQIFDKNTGALIPFNSLSVTDFISVDTTKKYEVYPNTASNLAAMYDINKNYIGVIKAIANVDKKQLLALDSRTYFIRLNASTSDVSSLGLYENSLPHYEEPETKVNIKELQVHKEQIIGDIGYSPYEKFENKNIVVAGDSLLALDQVPAPWDTNYTVVGYVTHMKNAFKSSNITNIAVSGAKMISGATKSIHDKITTTNLANTNYIIFDGGSNDSGVSPIGVIGSRLDTTFDTTTYIGALRNIIHYCYTQNRKIKIYLLSPSQMDTTGDTTEWGKWLPYCQAMEQVANMYGIPILRMDQKMQNNAFNGEWKFADKVHYLNETAEQDAKEVLIPFLTNN